MPHVLPSLKTGRPVPYGLSSLGYKPFPDRLIGQGGVFETLGCGVLSELDLTPCPPVVPPKSEPFTQPELSGADVFGYELAYTCATGGNSQGKTNAEAKRLFDDRVDYHFGALYSTNLADDINVVFNPGAPYSAGCAFAEAANWVASSQFLTSIIFITPRIFSLLSQTHVFVYDGDRLFDHLGNRVVVLPFSAAPGGQPPLTGGQDYVYVQSSIPDIYKSEPFLLDDVERPLAQNSYQARWEGYGAFATDGSCTNIAIFVEACN